MSGAFEIARLDVYALEAKIGTPEWEWASRGGRRDGRVPAQVPMQVPVLVRAPARIRGREQARGLARESGSAVSPLAVYHARLGRCSGEVSVDRIPRRKRSMSIRSPAMRLEEPDSASSPPS